MAHSNDNTNEMHTASSKISQRPYETCQCLMSLFLSSGMHEMVIGSAASVYELCIQINATKKPLALLSVIKYKTGPRC